MPTILRRGPYRFYFRSVDGVEPPHIHVRRDNRFAKFWLNPVRLQNGGSFSQRDLRAIHRIIENYQDSLLEAWNDYFGA